MQLRRHGARPWCWTHTGVVHILLWV
jgi:hypothetical protein